MATIARSSTFNQRTLSLSLNGTRGNTLNRRLHTVEFSGGGSTWRDDLTQTPRETTRSPGRTPPVAACSSPTLLATAVVGKGEGILAAHNIDENMCCGNNPKEKLSQNKRRQSQQDTLPWSESRRLKIRA